jgi:hypothetical protein
MPNRLLTQEEANARLQALGLAPLRPAVPDHVRAACAHGFHRLHTTQMCCWCGSREEPQHGPYAPEGER